MKFFRLAILTLLCSCSLLKNSNSTSSESTPYERKVEYITSVNTKPEISYQKANLWLAKNLKNSKNAIQLQDEKTFTILAKISTSCNTVNSSIAMNFSFEAKNKKIKVIFDNISHVGDSSNPFSGIIGLYPRNEDQLADFKKNCLDGQVESLRKMIEEQSVNW